MRQLIASCKTSSECCMYRFVKRCIVSCTQIGCTWFGCINDPLQQPNLGFRIYFSLYSKVFSDEDDSEKPVLTKVKSFSCLW